MKTTIELAEPVYQQARARAALRGVSMCDFVTEAVNEKLQRSESARKAKGWRAAFGKAPAVEIRAVQERLDVEFSQIREDEWKCLDIGALPPT